MSVKSLREVRSQIKDLGFKLKIKSMSFGRSAVYTKMDGREMPDIFTSDSLQQWQPLVDWQHENNDDLKELRVIEDILGLYDQDYDQSLNDDMDMG